MPEVNKQHKDRLFKFVFGNPDHKEWTLSLYNALNGSDYANPEDIEFNTIEDAVYLGMQNDASFIVSFILWIWEHQASFNPNMPVRFLIYAGRLYDKYLTDHNIYRYGTVLRKLPKPKCVCFYNGTQEEPENMTLKLSDAFEPEGVEPDIEVTVRMLNINYGHNMELMNKSSILNEYAWFIDAIRGRQKVMNSIEAAVDAAIEEMPENFVLKKFLVAHKAEVKGMYLTEYNEEKERQLAREEAAMLGREEGRAEGREEGQAEEKKRTVEAMLRENLPLPLIEKISSLSADAIGTIAQSLGISVVS